LSACAGGSAARRSPRKGKGRPGAAFSSEAFPPDAGAPRNNEPKELHMATSAAAKKKFEIDVEGTLFPWDKDTISVSEIRDLGDLPSDVPVIEIDFKDNTERELAEDDIIDLKPGKGFGKRVGFKRG
jgi:hypothetical protein